MVDAPAVNVVFPTPFPTAEDFRAELGHASGAGALGFSYSETYNDGTVGALLKGEMVNVRAAPFNAAGTGLVDDTAAINAAVATLSAGKTLYFPSGTYLVSKQSGVHTVVNKIPEGANVYGEPGSRIKVSTGSLTSQIFTPSGNNVFYGLDMDGESLPEASAVESAGWATESHAIRSFADASYGIGATKVWVINCRFRNFNYAIQTWGAQDWKILDSRFERIKNSAVLHEYLELGASNYHCLRNITANCDFEELGDTAVAYHKSTAATGAAGECAFNIVSSCTAKNTNLRTQGGAFDHEENADPTKQHHNLFIGLTVEQTDRGIAHGRIAAIMNGGTNSVISGVVATGSLEGPGDFGVAMKGRDGLITDCVLQGFRGAGITVDGSTRINVSNNVIRNCGGNSSVAPAIQIAEAYATSHIQVAGNRISFSDDYTTYGSASSVGIAARNPGGLVSDITVENNTIISKWATGIYLQGNLHASGFKRANLSGNEIIGTSAVSDAGVAIQAYTVTQLSINGAVLTHVNNGYTAQNCTTVTICNGEAKGDLYGMSALYDFTGSTGVRVSAMRCNVGVTTPVVNAGTGTVWVNDNKVSASVKGTTAARPTLTAEDVGFGPYLDTTLDADGKPIWWNGTAWVDATGATV